MSRILVVEDEPAIAELIAINLRHAGFEVTVAADADEAQDVVDGVLPALVVLDWMLPGRSGYVLVRQWRAVPRTVSIMCWQSTGVSVSRKRLMWTSTVRSSMKT